MRLLFVISKKFFLHEFAQNNNNLYLIYLTMIYRQMDL